MTEPESDYLVVPDPGRLFLAIGAGDMPENAQKVAAAILIDLIKDQCPGYEFTIEEIIEWSHTMTAEELNILMTGQP